MRPTITVLFLFCFTCLSPKLSAQFEMRGWELGGWLGSSFYLGDLNTDFGFNRPNLAGGVAARYNFNHRIAARASLNYGRVEAYDSDSDNTFERLRNLSFRSSIIDLSTQMEFNFLPYYHGSPEYFFTPYAFVGVSVFRFNPTTQDNEGNWVELRNIQTEGVKYSAISTALNYGIGIRWDLTYELSMDAHVGVRNTSTDYIDDVSTIYVERSLLSNDLARRYSDRSLPLPDGGRIDRTNTQRGDATVNDRYLFIGIGLNYYFGDIRCPQIEKGKARRRMNRQTKKISRPRKKRSN